jgi:hypothetical protein
MTKAFVQVAKELNQLTKRDIVEYYNAKISSSGGERRALVVSVTSQHHSEEGNRSEKKRPHPIDNPTMELKDVLGISTTSDKIGLDAWGRPKVELLSLYEQARAAVQRLKRLL